MRATSSETGWPPFITIAVLVLALFAMRLVAPPNLLDQDQENPAIYVLDAVKNGHWICQRDLGGGITSKPPFYTWCAAVVSLAAGRVSLFSLYLPGALAVLGTAWLVLAYGRKYFGERGGFFAALACLLCSAGLKEMGLARTDGVFAFLVTAAALMAYRAWLKGYGWTWFWLLAAAATLTKGPLGLVLGASGLVAAFWEARSGAAMPLRGGQGPGILLYLLLTVGWLLLAWHQFGHALIDKLFLQELVFHVVEGEQKKLPGSMIYLSPLYYLARAAPWSVLAYYGLWRIWKAPELGLEERRFERFVFCWFVLGLLLFSLAPHQRGDLLWPIMPAGALVAGRELARLTRAIARPRLALVTTILMVGGALGFSVYYLGPHARNPLVKQTQALQRLAEECRRSSIPASALVHVDDPAGLQLFLNTYTPTTSFLEVAEVLRRTNRVYVAITDLAKLQSARASKDPPYFTLLEDDGPVDRLRVRIISNRPGLEAAGITR